jgi:phosphatidylglycerol:prolipoprotein diacylglycerol transferase
MFPTLVKIGSFEITTFGLMMFLAFITAGWVLARQFRMYGLNEEVASSMVVAAALGGIIGAKIYYAILFGNWRLLFDRAGLVWYGGLIGGFLACSWLVWRHKIDYLTAADAAAPALSIGYALGRIGCFLVGDDYGRPSTLPWAVAFPRPPGTASPSRKAPPRRTRTSSASSARQSTRPSPITRSSPSTPPSSTRRPWPWSCSAS